MQVQEYLFKSPYPSSMQMGIPQNKPQDNDKTANQDTNIEDQKTQIKIEDNTIKTQEIATEATSKTNKLDIYA